MGSTRIGLRSISTSEVLRSYRTLATERQRIYHARLAGLPGPWTDDKIISQHRFTNAYRAADRVSQHLIGVIYDGPQEPEDIVLRTLMYRFFNKPSTWVALESKFGAVTWESFRVRDYAETLDSLLAEGRRVYSAAYIVPPPPFGAVRKHLNHLLLIEYMMRDGLSRKIARAQSLQEVFETICGYPSLGPFLGYQFTIDLNYSNLINYDENDFVVAGPGARSGIAKCFTDAGGNKDEDIIRWMVDTQNEQLASLGLDFRDLFGRPLTLIDCQNLFCETDKYARVAHPHLEGIGKRTRIKQQFINAGPLAHPFFPPKWRLNEQIALTTSISNPDSQLALWA